MTAEQLKIVDCATNHEKIVIGTMVQQEQIMMDAARQEENISEAAKEREQIVEILTRQATEIERTREDREKLVKACKNQEKCVSIVMGEKDKLVQSIGLQKNGMEELRKSVSELYKHTTYSDGSPKFDTTELASSPKFDTTELASSPKFDKTKVAISHQFDKTELARLDKQGVAKVVDDERINTKPEEKAEEVVLETVLLEPGNDFENMESNNMLNSSTIVISSPPTNYKGDNYEMNKEQAIQEEVHNALNRIKSTRAAQSSSLTQQANAGIGNTIPTSITVDRQEEALTAESKRLNRDLFYAKENKIREAIQSHQGGGQKVPTTTSKDVSSIPPSSTIQATLSMNQSRQNFSDRPLIDPPSMVSNNQNEPNLTIHPTSSIPSGIHMNRRDQNPHIPTSVHMTQLPFQPTTVHMNQNHHLPGSAHMNQNHHLNNVESSLGMHSGSDEDHNRGYMNQYNQALNLKPPMSIHPSAQMNPNHHMNMVDSSGGMRYRTDEVAKRSSSHINSGSNDDAESVQQLLMEAQRLVKLTDCYGNLEGDEAGNNSPRGEGLH